MILGTGVSCKLCKDRWGSVVLLTILLLCLCASSWGACVNQTNSCDYDGIRCDNGEVHIVGNNYCLGYKSNPSSCFALCGSASSNIVSLGYTCQSASFNRYYFYSNVIVCNSQAEADSVYCAQNPTAEGCKQEDVPQNCQEDYSECVGWGGVWKKVGSTSAGCQSECNLCGSKALTRVMNSVAASCCGKGKAPPDSISSCDMVAAAGVGMSMSRFNPGWNQCGDLSTSDGAPIVENANRFNRFCNEKDMYEEQADTNDVGGGEGSSSSEVESSASGTSFGTELDALGGIYGVLDTIRDTLVKRLTPATEEIRDCLYNFKLCAQLDSLYVDWSAMPKDSTWFYIDTGLVKYLRPFMDASVALDSNQLKAIRKLDTNALKQLRLDSALLENDTSTRRSVNSGFEGVLKNDTVTRRALNRLDTTVVSLDSSLRKGIREGTDNLIDSMDRYLGRVDSSIGAVGSNGTPLGDSLGSIHGAIDGVVNSLDSSIRSGYGSADTGSGNFPWISQGEGQRDSILGGGPGGTGFGGLDFGGDSAWMDSMENVGYICNGDSCCIGDKCEYFESDSMIVDSLRRHAQRLGDSVRALNDAFYRDSVDDIFTEVTDSLRAFNPLHIFDSTLLSELGASIPNSNTCPEHCSTFQVDIPFFFGTQHAVIDWGLCMGRTAFANGNVLSFLRFIIRIIVAVTCITAVMWNATRIRR